MSAEFAQRLRRYADVIVRVGLNLQAGQPLLMAEPFELQGVAPDAMALVEAIRNAARAAGGGAVEVIWGDEARWREAARRGRDREFERALVDHAIRMQTHVRQGGALLFLPSGHPNLMSGIPAGNVAGLREAGWRAYGHVAPDLIAGRTNWTTAAAPIASWATVVFPESSGVDALARLWDVVFSACRADAVDPIEVWRLHLADLSRMRDELNQRRAVSVRFVGEGTNLSVALAPGHRWCTANLRTGGGVSFVANLPTEELFTAPDRDGVDGIVRIARPVAYGGGLMVGVDLEFCAGRVVRAQAKEGQQLLQRLLQTDAGAARLGEVAIVPRALAALTAEGRCLHHVLLDENALDHIALGEAYPFTADRSGAAALNHSLVHLDLPVAATVLIDS